MSQYPFRDPCLQDFIYRVIKPFHPSSCYKVNFLILNMCPLLGYQGLDAECAFVVLRKNKYV